MWAKSLSNDFQFFRTSATNDYHPYFGGWLRRATTTRKEGDDIKIKVHIIIVSYVRQCKFFLGYSGDQYNTILCVEWRNSATGGIQCCWFHSPIMDRVGEQQRGKEKSPLAIWAKWIVIVGWKFFITLCCAASRRWGKRDQGVLKFDPVVLLLLLVMMKMKMIGDEMKLNSNRMHSAAFSHSVLCSLNNNKAAAI